MAVRIRTRKRLQIVSPLRFVRVGNGMPSAEDPDPDDRGFAMGRRPFGWGTTDARGAMVGITQGQVINLRVLREDIDSAAPLFVTASPADLVEIVAPARGRALSPALADLTIRGIRDESFRCGKIEVRLGSERGPVLGEMEVHIFSVLRPRVVPHVHTILGVSADLGLPGLSEEGLRNHISNLFDTVNAIYSPTGIQFNLQISRIRFHSHTSGFRAAGTVTTDRDRNDEREVDRIQRTGRVNDAINVSFVHDMRDVNGDEFGGLTAPADGSAGLPGSTLADDTGGDDRAKIIAHELCHFLGADLHSDASADDSREIRQDVWAMRRLMKRSTGTWTHPPHHVDLGYGDNQSGAMIAFKDLAPDFTDSEVAKIRPTARRNA